MKVFTAILWLALVPCMAAAQNASLQAVLQPTIDSIRNTTPGSAERTAAVNLFLGRMSLVAAALDSGNLQFIIEANRIDKQVGGPSGSSGSTNLVTSGSVPRLLGFAVENGALSQTVSGTSITFRTNPAGLIQTLRAHGLAPSEQDIATRNTLAVLKRFNVGITFDANRESDRRFTGSYRQLESASVQVYLYNHRDPTHPGWQPLWEDFRKTVSATGGTGTQLANAINTFGATLRTSSGYAELQAQARQDLNTAAPDRVAAFLMEYVQKASKLAVTSEAKNVTNLWTSYLREQRTLYDEVARSRILTLEYVLTRAPIQSVPNIVSPLQPTEALPDVSVLRLVFVRPFIGASDMTINASIGLFNQALPSMHGNIRDWQIGGKLDFPLPEITGMSKGQLTFSGLFMKLRQAPLGVPVQINGQDVAEKGDIGLFQARVRFPLGDSGFNVPLSVTYASRTELLNESEVRGNIGLTFDLDKLFARDAGK
jgi:hypothetical protein